MAIKPILFNTEMVRAILDGRKTCTRRVIELPENMDGVPVGKSGDSSNPLGFMYPGGIKRPPYQPGDILYVRETWCALPVNEAGHMRGHSIYYYRADGDLRPEGWRGKWRPSIHMPKEAARIWLKVTDVRVERLQEIDEDGVWELKFDYPHPRVCIPAVAVEVGFLDGGVPQFPTKQLSYRHVAIFNTAHTWTI